MIMTVFAHCLCATGRISARLPKKQKTIASYCVLSSDVNKSQCSGVIFVSCRVRMVCRSMSSAPSDTSAAVIFSKYGLSAADNAPSPHPASQSVRQPESLGARMAARRA